MDNETLTSWAGLITAAAALFAILEMRLQRVFGYRPELVVLAPSLRLSPAQGTPPWSCSPKEVTSEGAQHHESGAVVDCINVGVGVARNVVATWEFDRQLAVEQISLFLVKHGYSIWTSEDGGLSKIELEERNHSRVTIIGDLSAATRVPYLLPLQAPEHVIHIPLPPDFLLLLRLHVHCVPNDSTQLMTLQRLPPLVLQLAFTDAGGATRKDTVELRFHLTYLASNTDSDGSESATAAEATADVTSTRKRWLWRQL